MEEILRDIPAQFDTDRLTIRCPVPGDGEEVHVAVLESIDEFRPWLAFATPTPTPEDSETFVRKSHAAFLNRERFAMLLFLKTSNTLVGSTGFHNVEWSVPSAEIGYWVRLRYAGKGYMTEALKGLTEFGLHTVGFRRLEIRCDVRNESSSAVARRAGYVHEGTLRCDKRDIITGQLSDTLVFSRVLPEPPSSDQM